MHDQNRSKFLAALREIAFALLLLSSTSVVRATVYEVGPGDNYVLAMVGLQAGDTLILDGGAYTLNGNLALSLSGTAELPIVIQAKPGQTPVFNQTNVNFNVVQINSATYLTLDGIEITGHGIGLRIGAGNDITVRNCHVHDTTEGGISVNTSGSDYARISIVHNEIDHATDPVSSNTGVAIYLGCLNDDCRVHDSLIAGNYIHDQNSAAGNLNNGILIRHGSYANVVQDNVVHDTLGAAIVTADVNGHGGANIIERNAVWNVSDYGIQLGSDSVARNNIVLQSTGAYGIAVTYPQVTPANVVVVNNTVVSSTGGIRVTSASGPIAIANNAIHAASGNAISATTTGGGVVTAVANAGQGALSGLAAGFDGSGNLANDFFAASLSGAPPQNLVPRGTLLPGGADAGTLAGDDFCGRARGGQDDIGAYQANPTGFPTCSVSAGFKVPDRIFSFGFEAWL